MLASGSMDATVRLWNVDSGSVVGTLAGHTASVAAVAFSGDGRTVVSGSRDRDLRMWTSTGEPLAVLRSIRGTTASYVFTEGSSPRIELFGEQAREYPVCRFGARSYPFELCAERFETKDLLPAMVARDATHLEP
jgi:WD40 repeat protein